MSRGFIRACNGAYSFKLQWRLATVTRPIAAVQSLQELGQRSWLLTAMLHRPEKVVYGTKRTKIRGQPQHVCYQQLFSV
jgi:hypothetical protein